MSSNRMFAVALIPLLAVSLVAAPGGKGKKKTELDEAEVFTEFNSTDGDFGIQFFWDGDAWSRMTVRGPDGKKVMNVSVKKNLKDQGMTEGFFESDEPSTSELSMKQFFKRFPEGTYDFSGKSLEGKELVGDTEFTHTLPAAPTNLVPAQGSTVSAVNPLVVSFDAVTQDLKGNPLTPEQYEVIVETEGEILKVFSMNLDGDTPNPQVTIPPQFLEPDTEYKFEVIVQEESGNRTISETEFTTLP